MLQLGHSNLDFQDSFSLPYGVYKVTKGKRPTTGLSDRLLSVNMPGESGSEVGFAGYISVGEAKCGPYNTVFLPSEFSYLGEGDVLRIDPVAKRIRVLYRAKAPSNALLLTERCNHYCIMCSQPPKAADDTQVAKDILDAIPLFSRRTRELILSGGEPTLTGDLFFEILRKIRGHLPKAAVHILSNGRTFASPEVAQRVASLQLNDLMFGIPLYSDDPERHNFVVQAKGAFDETVNGILNLKNAGVKVEVRVVLHRHTIPTLVGLARYIATNLTFVDHVAFMGLEAMGFARSNWNDLWVDPRDYQSTLRDSCRAVARRGIRTSVYNLPLCWLDPALLPFYVSSISDWKNEYLGTCNNCAAASRCGGFFASNVQKMDVGSLLTPFTLESFQAWSQSCAVAASAQ